MRASFFYFILLLFLAIDIYCFLSLSKYIHIRGFKMIYILMSILGWSGFIYMLFSRFNSADALPSFTYNFLLSLSFAIIVPKLVAGAILIVKDIVQLFWRLLSSSSAIQSFGLGVSIFSLSILILLFCGIMYGNLWGRYQYTSRTRHISIPNLPKSFKGFKIVQISDIHLGTMDTPSKIQKAVNQINALEPDLIVCTGDMVNSSAKEAIPFVKYFRKLKAPYGKYTIMGNHDYAIHSSFNSIQRRKNIEELVTIEKEMGFRWLNNEAISLKKNNDSIRLLGVENWGLPPFPQKGDLQKAMDPNDPTPTILLSHDPTHWTEKVVNKYPSIYLTLSGHTHGMQMGIDFQSFQWSPVQYKYPLWSGIYSRGNQKLYVNRGLGSIGYPGRLGVWPEIALLILE